MIMAFRRCVRVRCCMTCILAAIAIALGVKSAESTQQALPRLDRTNLMVFHTARGETVPVRTIQEWQLRRAEILAAFQSIAGPKPGVEKDCPLDARVEEEADCGGYLRRFLTYASEPGSRVPAYLLIPKSVLEGK